MRNRRLFVLYDGYCPVCRRSAKIIHYLDILGVIELRKYQDFKIKDLPVSIEKLGGRVHACNKNFEKCSEGIFAFASIMIRIPPLFIPSVFCFLLGNIGFGQKVYDYISDNRYNLPFAGLSRFIPFGPKVTKSTEDDG